MKKYFNFYLIVITILITAPYLPIYLPQSIADWYIRNSYFLIPLLLFLLAFIGLVISFLYKKNRVFAGITILLLLFGGSLLRDISNRIIIFQNNSNEKISSSVISEIYHDGHDNSMIIIFPNTFLTDTYRNVLVYKENHGQSYLYETTQNEGIIPIKRYNNDWYYGLR